MDRREQAFRSDGQTDPKLDPIVVAGCEGTPGQGPHLAIVLRVSGRRITQARFSTYGCPTALACGQWVADRIEGATLEEARTINAAQLTAAVGQMPLGREHCPGLAVGALRAALSQIVDENREAPSTS